MPRQIKPHGRRKSAAAANARRPSDAALEAMREMLMHRLDNLGPEAKQAYGYKSALRLLNQKFRLATLSARAGILQAASFMIDVLERTPPLL